MIAGASLSVEVFLRNLLDPTRGNVVCGLICRYRENVLYAKPIDKPNYLDSIYVSCLDQCGEMLLKALVFLIEVASNFDFFKPSRLDGINVSGCYRFRP